ncbi:MAG: hypothetical protein GX862_07320 [Leucobacter sp.]|jgi:hypothetical protein|nr:hypothetical protein [Leucobacter sp.]
MIARALGAVGGKNLTPEDLADGKLEECERREYLGEGADWEAAKAAANVPADTQVLYWYQVD